MRRQAWVPIMYAFFFTALAAAASADPILYRDGSERYAAEGHGIPVVTIQAADLCDIELQSGEKINQAILSDTTRWRMTDGVSGHDVPHVFVKPTEAGLHALLTITTTRRTYHIRLVSTNGIGSEFVGFYYPSLTSHRGPIAAAVAPSPSAAPTAPPAWTCAAPLDTQYRVDGATQFRPVSVCNDGLHTYVNLGPIDGTLPVLVKVGDGNQDQLGNVSFDDAHAEYVLDGVPSHLALLRDSPKGQTRVNISRIR